MSKKGTSGHNTLANAIELRVPSVKLSRVRTAEFSLEGRYKFAPSFTQKPQNIHYSFKNKADTSADDLIQKSYQLLLPQPEVGSQEPLREKSIKYLKAFQEGAARVELKMRLLR